MKIEFNPCIIVPCYNHAELLAKVIKKLITFNFPIFIIDDGSTLNNKQVLADIIEENKNCHLCTLPINKGKGYAVMFGFIEAMQLGFTHAIQIDADGQHDINDIPKFLALSNDNPNALISGTPIYDASIPKARLYSRYITHFWVMIETLSLSIRDSMCGFRVYPLNETVKLIKDNYIGHYMDFDTEIMVKLYWQNVPVIFIETKVIYPEIGTSNFRMVRDNVRISWMHTRLFFGMLVRLPILIWRKCAK